jgi:glyceraldehyde-3-phosphate dehydrogenase (NAD(P)+) (phosphorylating)
MEKIKVAVNGYGVTGKRVAEAVMLQPGMELSGVCDVATDWRMKVANVKGIPVYAYNFDAYEKMRAAGITTAGILADLLKQADIVVDCTSKEFRVQNVKQYRKSGVEFIVQDGEKHETNRHPFATRATHETATGKTLARVVFCHTISIVKTLTALKNAAALKKARSTPPHQTTGPWENLRIDVMDTRLPEMNVPSCGEPDVQCIDPAPGVVTTAVKVPDSICYPQNGEMRWASPAAIKDAPGAFQITKPGALAISEFPDSIIIYRYSC